MDSAAATTLRAVSSGTGSLRFSSGGVNAYLQFATATPSVTANLGGSGSNLTIDNPLFQPSSTLTKSGSGIVQLAFNDAATANSFSANVPLVNATGGASLAVWNQSGVPIALPSVSFFSFNTGLTIRSGVNTVAAGRSIDLGGAGSLGVGSGGTLTFDPGSTLTAGNLMQTDQLLAGVVMLSVLGLLISWALGTIERVVLRWR